MYNDEQGSYCFTQVNRMKTRIAAFLCMDVLSRISGDGPFVCGVRETE